MKRILIIDGLNLFIRNWSAVPSMNANGEPNGGVVGSLRSIKMLVRDMNPSDVIVVWDGKGGAQKRRDMYSGYKDGRKPKLNRQYDFESQEQSSKNMGDQYLKLRQMIDMIGVTQIEIDAVEADDVIAFICTSIFHAAQKIIVSSDRDFFQLVDKNTLVYSPTKKVLHTTAEVKNVYGVLPGNYIYVKALTGDGSDNIKGIKGIGEKTAAKLFPFLNDHPSDTEEIFNYANLNVTKSAKYKSILENKEVILQNVKLMQLSSTIMSIQAVRATRQAVENSQPKFMLTELKLSFLRDGIQITDSDFFPVFEHQKVKGSA